MKGVDIMAFFEKYWDCHACGRPGISALRQMKCPGCGSTKSPQDKEYPTNKEITDKDGLELANGKPHWTCSNCGSVNLDKKTSCLGCGNERENSDLNNKIVELGSITLPEFKPKDIWEEHSDEPKPIIQIPKDINTEPETNFTTELPVKKLPWKKLLIITGSILIVVILGWLFFHTVSVEAKIDNFYWTRIISIERYQSVHESGWHNPIGSYNVRSEIRIARYEPIYQTRTRTVTHPQTNYRDLGNGAVQSYTTYHTTTETYQEVIGQKPIYATWYEYDIDKWLFQRKEISAANDRKPYWPNYNLNLDGFTVIGAERVGGKTELYQVLFETSNPNKEEKIFTYEVNQDEWYRYNTNLTYELKINHFGIITNNPLKDKESQ